MSALEAAALANGEDMDVSGPGMGPVSLLRALRSSRVLLLLTSCPFVIPFHTRVELFTGLRKADKEEHTAQLHGFNMLEAMDGAERLQFSVRRSSLLADSFKAFRSIHALDPSGKRLKERLFLNFVNDQGMAEAGIDGGGLLKEFIDSVVRDAFSPSAGLFKSTEAHLMYPNPDPSPPVLGGGAGPWAGVHPRPPSSTELYEFLGRLLGKALYEGILVEPRFAHFVLRRILGRGISVDDLPGYDAALSAGIGRLKEDAARWVGGGRVGPDPLADLGLSMSITDEVRGVAVSVPLISGGDGVAVTSHNLDAYIARLARYRLHTCVAPQVRAFLRGFRELIPLPWIRMFGASELAVLLGGKEGGGFDVADLKANAGYGNGYHPDHPVILALWRVLEGFTSGDKAAFLSFVTSVPRPPLLGFASLHPKFGIARLPITEDGEKLPIAATCANLLKLPTYSTEAVLREKLLYAIHAGAGFELT